MCAYHRRVNTGTPEVFGKGQSFTEASVVLRRKVFIQREVDLESGSELQLWNISKWSWLFFTAVLSRALEQVVVHGIC